MADADMEDASGRSFVLSYLIEAHKSDVKALATTESGFIISGSRDEYVKVFDSRDGKHSEAQSTKRCDKLAINAVAFYQLPAGCSTIFAGRKDGSIAIYTLSEEEPVQVVKAHKLNVCALHVDAVNGKILSGSWDSTANVWSIADLMDGNDKRIILTGHKMSVWAVAAVTDRPNFYLTGSADTVIKFWNKEVEVNSFSGHEDVVRSIIVVNSQRFLSASNDSSIRLWDLDAGVCLHKFSSLSGEYIYSMKFLSCFGSNYVVNVGEGGFVEFWEITQEGLLDHKQLLRTPTQSIWAVDSMSNGDVVIGADDGRIYAFTAAPERKANQEVLSFFESGVAEKIAAAEALQAVQQQEVVKIKVSLEDGHPDMELRYKKGSDPADAAQVFITENNLPISFLDEIVEYIKTNIPEARHAANKKRAFLQPRQRVTVDGREWDYVFDVTTENGRVLKLTYNIGEDVNWAAQRFVEKHNLPIQFLEKVSELLKMQVPGFSDAPSISFADPFTGGNRYIPGGVNNGSDIKADPFTGTNRYIPPARDDGPGPSSGFVDPFTGGGAYRPGDSSKLLPKASISQDRTRPWGEHVPIRKYAKFDLEQASSKAIEKLKELNETQGECRLSDEQVKAMEEVLTTRIYEVRDAHVSAIDLGLCWPIDSLVPVLDVFRLALLNRTLNKIYCDIKGEEGRPARGRETLQKLNALLLSAQRDPVKILVCRAIANSAVHQWGRDMLLFDIKTNISTLMLQLTSPKPVLQVAATSALANYSFLLSQQTEKDGGVAELGPREDAMRAVIQGLQEPQCWSLWSEATQIQLLQSIATLMWGDKAIIKLAKARDIVAIVNRMKDSVTSEDGKAIARDILGMTYAV